MDRKLSRRDVWLWGAVIICIAYVALWVCGIRIPPPRPRTPAVVLDDYEDDYEDEDPIEETSFSDKEFDVVLPEEPEVIDDGRDPDPNAFLL